MAAKPLVFYSTEALLLFSRERNGLDAKIT